MAQAQLLNIEPSTEIMFLGPFTDVVTSVLQLTNPTDKPVCFKVKTTAPKQYYVRPNSGEIQSKGTAKISIMLQPMDGIPADVARHKFMVQSCFSPIGEIVDLKTIWKTANPSDLMYNQLRVNFSQGGTASKAREEAPARVKMTSPLAAAKETSGTSHDTNAKAAFSGPMDKAKHSSSDHICSPPHKRSRIELSKEIAEDGEGDGIHVGERLSCSEFGLRSRGLRPRKLAWSDTIYSVPVKTDVKSQSDASVSQFRLIFSELANNKPSSLGSEHSAILPSADVLSGLFTTIVKDGSGEMFNASEIVYRMLSRTFSCHPPLDSKMRVYWLNFLSPSTMDQAKQNRITNQVDALRDMIKKEFTSGLSNHGVQELIVCVLEADLFAEKLRVERDGRTQTEWTGRVTRISKSSELDGVPLAYTLWNDANQRTTGLGQKAKTAVRDLIHVICEPNNTMLSRELTLRLLRVCLQSLRLMCSQELESLNQDMKYLLSFMKQYGKKSSEAAALLQLDWIDIAD